MININIIDDKIAVKKDKNLIWLNTEESVQNEFLSILDKDENAFFDDMSVKMLRELYKYERAGNYGIKTEDREVCIACIPSELKLGLAIIYYANNNPDTKIITRLLYTYSEVLRFLNDNIDVDLYLFIDDFAYSNIPTEANSYLFYDFSCLNIPTGFEQYKFNNEIITSDRLWRNSLKAIKKCQLLTKEEEETAYKYYLKNELCSLYSDDYKYYHRNLMEKMNLYEYLEKLNYRYFNTRFYGFRDYEINRLKNYTLVNFCNYLPKHFNEFGMYYEIYKIVIKDDVLSFQEDFLKREIDTGILGCIIEGILKSKNYDKRLNIYHTPKAVPKHYTDKVAFGILTDNKEQTIYILDKKRAIEELHKCFQSEGLVIEYI